MAALISLLLPTRGRPELASRFMDSVQQQSNQLQDVEVILCIDEDDIGSHDLDCPGLKITKIIGPRNTMGALNTACLRASHGDIVILVNDDMVIRTQGWDDIIREVDASLEDKIYLAYGNDLYKGEKLCSFPILSRRTCELLTDPFPANYKGAFIDYHLLDIFRRLQHAGHDRIRYLENVAFEHMHFRSGKAEMDATYKERNRFGDDGVYISLRNYRELAAKTLLAAIRGEQAEAMPSAPKVAAIEVTFGQIVLGNIKLFLMDGGLPFRWRFFLYIWYLGRYLASKK